MAPLVNRAVTSIRVDITETTTVGGDAGGGSGGGGAGDGKNCA